MEDKLAAYAAGDCKGSERSAVEAHIEACAGCRHELLALLESDETFARYAFEQEPPVSIWQRIAARLAEQQEQRRKGWIKLAGNLRLLEPAWARAVVVALLLLLALGGASLYLGWREKQAILAEMKAFELEIYRYSENPFKAALGPKEKNPFKAKSAGTGPTAKL